MFSVDDRIVHPMHGAGVIESIVEKTIGDTTEPFYALKLIMDNVVIFVPVRSCDEVGVRAICSPEKARELLERFDDIVHDEDQSWNRRYRENMLRIRSGDIYEVAKVVKNLSDRDHKRGLSTGEKRLFQSARQILTSELALALDRPLDVIEEQLNHRLCPSEA